MQVIFHVLFGFIFGLILYPFIGLYSVIVFFSGFLFDVDHYLYYAVKKRDFSLINSYLYCIPGSKVHEPHNDVLHIFHTWEMWLLILILTVFVHEIFLFVLVGLIFHMLFDWGILIFYEDIDSRAWSLIGWLGRN